MLPEFAIFPTDSVAVSLTTTVWVGVLVVTFFNLRFGWTLSGLTVPGYVVPLLMFKPTSAIIIFCEALLTFWLVYAVSEWPRNSKVWCSFFGRDRFLALVIGSVIVRAALEGWVLPWLGPHIDDFAGWQIDYRNDLHSYGLIIVSLMANYFWKPGVIRGGAALGASILMTYLIVRVFFIELTNLNVSDIGNLYEDISASLLASPKAYIVILTASLIASWLNLKYSWDYNGILIPSLLALLWFDPMKVALSFIEAGVLLGLAALILKLPTFRKVNVEGARRTALFFSICFVYRLAICHFVQNFWPSLHITDLFGFGYLLTTLLAIKAHQKKITGRLVKVTVQASTLGAVVGNLAGFGMTFMPTEWLSPVPQQAWASPSYDVDRIDESLMGVIRQDKIMLYRQRSSNIVLPPSRGQISHFRVGMEQICKYVKSKSPRDLDAARAKLRAANFDVRLVADRFLHIRERDLQSANGWGVYVFDLHATSQLMIGVPRPLDEGTLASGLCLFREMNAAVLAIGSGNTAKSNGIDSIADRNSLFANFHEILPSSGVLHVRSNPRPAEPYAETKTVDESTLWVSGQIPSDLNLSRVKSLTSKFEINWTHAPEKNVVRDQQHDGFAELWLDAFDRRRLQSSLLSSRSVTQFAKARYEKGSLSRLLVQVRDEMAKKNSDLYRPPQLAEMLLMDEEVLQPLFRLVTDWHSELPKHQLDEISASASILGYSTTIVEDAARGEEFLVLHEIGEDRRYWGTFVFRKAPWSNNIVEVPRPLAERQSFEFGASLFQQLDACALFLGGSHPLANRDGSADLGRLTNKCNVFQLVHQSFLREAGDRPLLVLQSRSIRSPVRTDVVMACGDGAAMAELSPLKGNVLQSLQDMGLTVTVVNGDPATAGYETNILLQASSLNHSQNNELLSLWVSPTLRSHYQTLENQRQLRGQFESLGIPLVSDDLFVFVGQCEQGYDRSQPIGDDIPNQLKVAVNEFLETRDIVRLSAIKKQYRQYTFKRIDDESTSQVFLAIQSPRFAMPWLVNVTGSVGDRRRQIVCQLGDKSNLHRFVKTRATWLRFEGNSQ